MAGRIKYAQLLNDASEIRYRDGDPKKKADTITPKDRRGTVTLELPIAKPPVAVPVIELFLKSPS